ncbi:MAG TPA: hypothetical protein VGD67_08195 [Pseudonocardiaceae bacterium]
MSAWGMDSDPSWMATMRKHEPRDVWVLLAHAFAPPHTPDKATGPVAPLRGEVRGELHHWLRAEPGWYGLVEFYVDHITGPLRMLVPDAALRPRDDDRTLNGTPRRSRLDR